jgi:large subunit ribosomal protein L4
MQYSAIEPNNHAVYLDVKQYLANQRQGDTRLKKELKLREVHVRLRTKGTGTARAGSAKNPLLFKGGAGFRTKTKKLFIKLNKNLKRLARKSAFSIKAKEQILSFLKILNLKHQTLKNFINVLKALELEIKVSPCW